MQVEITESWIYKAFFVPIILFSFLPVCREPLLGKKEGSRKKNFEKKYLIMKICVIN